jgi:farnesyl-diphosphate farnesyltransferase
MADLDDLLEKTSRTFALSIPPLPEPTRREVSVAYLLFRIADTFEDSTRWPRAARIEALSDFGRLVEDPDPDLARRLADRWIADSPTDHAGYRELLAESPSVLADFRALAPAARDAIAHHVAASSRGMARFVSRMSESGALALSSVAELREYCYAVAGIVGEMLTELFLIGREELEGIAPDLRARARFFGEGLQLVNILKDSASDRSDGRCYLPASTDRAEVFALARSDLNRAAEYILALQGAGAPRGLLAFTALPVELAWAALERIEREGPGSKVPRVEVFRIVQHVKRNLDRHRPAARIRPAAPPAG